MRSFVFRRSFEPATNIRALVYHHAASANVVLLKLDGYLDNGNTPAFLKFCRGLSDGGVTVLGLDLSRLNYMSSTGVGALSALTLDAKKKGGFFFLSGIPDKIGRVLQLLGFLDLIPVIDDPAAYDFTVVNGSGTGGTAVTKPHPAGP
jgi:anti-anti-sigma factor